METAEDSNDQESVEFVGTRKSDDANSLSKNVDRHRIAKGNTTTSCEDTSFSRNNLLDVLDRLDKMDSRLRGIENDVREMHQYIKHGGICRTGVTIVKKNPERRGTDYLEHQLQPEKGNSEYPEHISTLRAGIGSLIENLEPNDLECELISKNVLSVSDVESIKGEKRRSDRVRQLVCVLCQKSPESYDHFLESLRKSYSFLAKHLDRIKTTAEEPSTKIHQCSICLLRSEIDIRDVTDYMFKHGTITPEVFRELSTKTISLGVRWAQLLQVVNYEPGGVQLRDSFFAALMLANTRIYSLTHQFFSMNNKLECHCPKSPEELDQLQNVWLLSQQSKPELPYLYDNRNENAWVRVWIQKSQFSLADSDFSASREQSRGHSNENQEASSESDDEMAAHRVFHSLSQSQMTTEDELTEDTVFTAGKENEQRIDAFRSFCHW